MVIFFYFWPLVAVLRVFNREFMQPELLLHRLKLSRLGIRERDPDETVRAGDIGTDFTYRNVGELAAVLVSHAVDEHRCLAT